MVAFVVELFAILGFAALSDRIGRRPVYMFGALAGVALAFPFFWLVSTKEWIWIALAFILARAVVTAAMFGPQAAYFAELFPPQRRFAGFAFARELGSLLAGGPAPFLATALVAWASGAWWPVAIYVIVLSLLTTWAIWAGPETFDESITADNSQPVRIGAAGAGLIRWRSNFASCNRSGRWSGGARTQREWPLQTQLEMIRDAGFDGAGVRFIDPAFATEVTGFLRASRPDLAGAVLSDLRSTI